MKQTLLIFALLLATVFAADAQSIGVRAGVNYSGFSGDDSFASDRMFRFHAGLTSKFFLTTDEFFAIQPELLFSLKGAESDDDDFKVKVSYIDVPVLAHINAGPIYFEAGPQVSFRVGGDIELNGTNIQDDLDDFKRTSLGYAAGVGFVAGASGLTVGVRYNGDISKLYDNDNISDARNSVFMLTLAYTLPGR
ncbi:outer membrane protein with beta-barrel domain [Pontibacter mucosus]|uniref:Outer membrane protein with beta-barrel domain n=1 Tax=Pontibacter mucosus TaxID=1649266 RepID=A0A2T5YU77_9BACT|nr:porin family protein [Pontibacter mucosus]PTX22869.1 outer membrane protein with beta-barrel domain [Pontibacter mucosus]